MNRWHYYNGVIAIAIFTVLFVLLYPFYQYVFDSDGVGYMMVSKRLAEGDIYKSLNGYWSPLHSWLIVPFVKLGLSVIHCFKISNAFISIGILYCFKVFLQRLKIKIQVQTVLLFTAVPMLLYFSFYELAADLLVCFVWMLYLLVITSHNFFESKYKIALAGIIGALSYFAKTYALPFFIAHFTLLHVYYYFRNKNTFSKFKALQNCMLAFAILLLICLPRFMAIQDKYKIYSIGTASELNQSWYLNPGTHNNEIFFLPPPYTDSPCWWEDPFFTQKKYYNAFSSPEIFVAQLKQFRHNIKIAFFNFSEITVFSILLIAALLYLEWKKKAFTTYSIFLITILLLPLGYLPVHIETRFLWLLAFIILVSVPNILFSLVGATSFINKRNWILFLITCISFVIAPIFNLIKLKDVDKDSYDIAKSLKQKGYIGKMASNGIDDIGLKVAFYNNHQYYFNNIYEFSSAQLIHALKKDSIDFYLFMPNKNQNKPADSLLNFATKVDTSVYKRIWVLKLK